MDTPTDEIRITPYLMVDDARAAIDFYVEVFGAEPVGDPIVMDDGRIGHAELRFGASTLYLADDFPEYHSQVDAGPPTGVVMHLQVPDADAVWAKAVEAGAEVMMPLENQFWGDYFSSFTDKYGIKWMVDVGDPDSAGSTS